MLSIPEILRTLRARVGQLSARALADDGNNINTGAIDDANDNLNAAVDHYRNGDNEAAREALQLAAEQLDAAE